MWFAREIRAVRERDPASRSTLEVVLTSPGLHALVLHRAANWLWRRRLRLPGRMLSHINRALTGIEIHPGARIGRGVFIDHGMGVVVGETASIGDNVTMYQGVTLGGTGKQRGKRHPTVEQDAVIGVGASVLGAVTIGEGARVGAGSVVLKDVPPHTTAVGIPARAVSWRDPASGETRRLEHLPDPDRDTMIAMMQRIEELESRVGELEAERADRGPLAPAR
ncbi:MAG: serine O-acetyltransferase [Thermomicrobiales bacterium]|jgi:serine O-acetyltransferase|nr:serine O-acetyltransferase [Thermomicrobiales bacterium]